MSKHHASMTLEHTKRHRDKEQIIENNPTNVDKDVLYLLYYVNLV